MSNKPSRAWCFTWPNPPNDSDSTLSLFASLPEFRYVVFQYEISESGLHHYQGYLELNKPSRRTAFNEYLGTGLHWEPRRGTADQAIEYATKEATRFQGPFTAGTRRGAGQGKRTDLQEAIEIFQEGGFTALREQKPSTYIRYIKGFREYALHTAQPVERRPPEVWLLFGPPGCGKTRTFHEAEHPSKISIPTGGGCWVDGYEDHEAVLFDDFAGRMSNWRLDTLLQALDRWPVNLPVKGGHVRWVPKHIYITTNIHPREWYDWTNREQQYPALVRRVTRVLWWKYGDELANVVDPDQYEWDRFWKGREAAQAVLDLQETAQTGRVVSRAPTLDYYDW